jgi:hypothetical protein
MATPLTGRYRWNPKASCRTLDGTAFVLLGRRMVSLNEVGTFIWARLEKGAALDEVVPLVVSAFETTEGTARADASAFFDRLVGEEMVVRC